MKKHWTILLLIAAFRILSVLCIALLCDFWFYSHMTAKWISLEKNNKSYLNKSSETDIKALFGPPDRTTSNSITYTVFNFSWSKTAFPITEILLSQSLDHIKRHDIEFYFDKNGKQCGMDESWNDKSFRKYKRVYVEPKNDIERFGGEIVIAPTWIPISGSATSEDGTICLSVTFIESQQFSPTAALCNLTVRNHDVPEVQWNGRVPVSPLTLERIERHTYLLKILEAETNRVKMVVHVLN